MTAFGKVLCWLLRQFGGKHKFRRPRKDEDFIVDGGGNFDAKQIRICNRCGHAKLAKTRKPRAA